MRAKFFIKHKNSRDVWLLQLLNQTENKTTRLPWVNLFNKDFWKLYKLNFLMQPKVIKLTSKYLDMMGGGAGILSQLLSETFRFKSSLNIRRFQGSSFLECDRIKAWSCSVQRGPLYSSVIGQCCQQKEMWCCCWKRKCLNQLSCPTEKSWKYSILTWTKCYSFA